jgi:hypothetical protein
MNSEFTINIISYYPWLRVQIIREVMLCHLLPLPDASEEATVIFSVEESRKKFCLCPSTLKDKGTMLILNVRKH